MSEFYKTLAPELRNSFPGEWLGFDLRGMSSGNAFYGCVKCGIQFTCCFGGVAMSNKCPNCNEAMPLHTVTDSDLVVGVLRGFNMGRTRKEQVKA